VKIAFISDRSGSGNVWIADSNGAHAKSLTRFNDGDDAILTSPAGAQTAPASSFPAITPRMFRSSAASYVATGATSVLIPMQTRPDTPPDARSSVVGAAPSRDGKWLYYAAQVGIARVESARLDHQAAQSRDWCDEAVVEPPRSYRPDLVLGTFFRPAPSPDGRLLVYGTAMDRPPGCAC